MTTDNELSQPSEPQHHYVMVCQNRSCLRNGSAKVLEAFQAVSIPEVRVSGSGCMGQCSSGPTVQVNPDRTWYCRIRVQDVPIIIEQHLVGGKPVERLLHPRFHPRSEFLMP